jgi:hypothetical protein
VVDLFDEVEEQLRSERYAAMAAKAVPYGIGALALALAVTLGLWGWQAYQKKQADKASDAYYAAMMDHDTNQTAKSLAEFKAIAATGPKAYRALALMQLGAAELDKNDAKAAAANFDAAAASGADLMITDAARLKSAFALMDTASYADTEAKLKLLAGDDRPYRTVAKEGLAFAKLQSGDMAGARSAFSALTLALDASPEMQDRARRILQLIDDGTAKSLPAAAKAAAAMPVLPLAPAPGAAQ